MSEVNHTHTITDDLIRLRNTGIGTDVVLEVSGTKIKAHKLVLAAGSEYFERLFFGSFSSTSDDEIEIEVDPIAFSSIMDIIYGKQYKYSDNEQGRNIALSLSYFQVRSLNRDIILNQVKLIPDPLYIIKTIEFLALLYPERDPISYMDSIYKQLVNILKSEDINTRKLLLDLSHYHHKHLDLSKIIHVLGDAPTDASEFKLYMDAVQEICYDLPIVDVLVLLKGRIDDSVDLSKMSSEFILVFLTHYEYSNIYSYYKIIVLTGQLEMFSVFNYDLVPNRLLRLIPEEYYEQMNGPLPRLSDEITYAGSGIEYIYNKLLFVEGYYLAIDGTGDAYFYLSESSRYIEGSIIEFYNVSIVHSDDDMYEEYMKFILTSDAIVPPPALRNLDTTTYDIPITPKDLEKFGRCPIIIKLYTVSDSESDYDSGYDSEEKHKSGTYFW
jgi:hypothetical protein